MEEGALWGACDPQPLQQVGLFNGAESQTSILLPESAYPQYWGSDAWRADEIPDIALMPVDTFDPVLSLPTVTGETIHDFAGATSKFLQQGQQQWGHSEFYPPPQDVPEILSGQYMQFNSSILPPPHLPQELNTFKPFGTITPVHPSRPVNVPYGSSSMPPGNRPGSSTIAIPYGGSPVSMGMYGPTNVPQRIISTSGMDGGCNSNMGFLQHLPKVHHSLPLASKTGGNVSVANVTGASTFSANQKSSSLSPLSDSSSRRRDSVVEEPKMANFNPGPYVNSARAVVQTQKQHEDMHRMWLDDNSNRGKSSAVPIPNSVHRQHQQAMSNSSPVTNMGFEQRSMSTSSPVINLSYEQRVMSNSSPVTTMGSSRHQKSIGNSSPSTRMVFEQRPKQPMTSSSPIPTVVGFEPSPQRQPLTSSSPVPIMGLQQHQPPMTSPSPIPIMGLQQHQPPMTSSSPVPIMGLQQHQSPMTSSSPIPVSCFEQRQQQQPMSNSSPSPNVGGLERRQQPTMSASPPLSNLSFEPRQTPPPPSMSSSPSTSNLVFEPRRPPPISNPSTVPNVARQHPTPSKPRPDSGESVPKWPSGRMMGGCPVVPGSEKTPIVRQQLETVTIKCALPRNTSANSSPAANANSVNKRPLWPEDNKNNQGGSMNKKPMQKFHGNPGCSRLEEISAAAHQKVTQNTSGRALGPALNTNLKPRARQGSANDPQSIAARVRRERISERLKVLQTLIPNGDKVDMVTMLEKAINYVQCLELQIRMLKNDSLWPKALGPLPNTLQELLELAGPEFMGGKDLEEAVSEITTIAPATKKSAPEVIEFDGHQPSADKE